MTSKKTIANIVRRFECSKHRHNIHSSLAILMPIYATAKTVDRTAFTLTWCVYPFSDVFVIVQGSFLVGFVCFIEEKKRGTTNSGFHFPPMVSICSFWPAVHNINQLWQLNPIADSPPILVLTQQRHQQQHDNIKRDDGLIGLRIILLDR